MSHSQHAEKKPKDDSMDNCFMWRQWHFLLSSHFFLNMSLFLSFLPNS